LGYQMGEGGIGPGRVVVTAAHDQAELGAELAHQGLPEQAIELLVYQGQSVMVESTQTVFGVSAEVVTLDTPFHPKLAYGQVESHPLRPVEREYMLKDFGQPSDRPGSYRLRRDETVVSDARINTANWSHEELTELDQRFQVVYGGSLFGMGMVSEG